MHFTYDISMVLRVICFCTLIGKSPFEVSKILKIKGHALSLFEWRLLNNNICVEIYHDQQIGFIPVLYNVIQKNLQVTVVLKQFEKCSFCMSSQSSNWIALLLLYVPVLHWFCFEIGLTAFDCASKHVKRAPEDLVTEDYFIYFDADLYLPQNKRFRILNL